MSRLPRAVTLALSGLMLTTSTPVLSGNIQIGATSGDAERRNFSEWISAVDLVVKSPQFRANLVSLADIYPSVYLAQDGNNAPHLATVKDMAAMLPPGTGYRYVPVPVALVGDTYSDAAYGGWTGFADSNGQSLGSLTLGRLHLKRWLSQDVVEKSCAINTLAHEHSHTLSSHSQFYNMVFLDQDRRKAPAGVPSASYLIGTAAQCTWLQQQGRVKPNGFKACVAVFGTRHFNSNRCSAFSANQEVVERADLPAPASD